MYATNYSTSTSAVNSEEEKQCTANYYTLGAPCFLNYQEPILFYNPVRKQQKSQLFFLGGSPANCSLLKSSLAGVLDQWWRSVRWTCSLLVCSSALGGGCRVCLGGTGSPPRTLVWNLLPSRCCWTTGDDGNWAPTTSGGPCPRTWLFLNLCLCKFASLGDLLLLPCLSAGIFMAS